MQFRSLLLSAGNTPQCKPNAAIILYATEWCSRTIDHVCVFELSKCASCSNVWTGRVLMICNLRGGELNATESGITLIKLLFS